MVTYITFMFKCEIYQTLIYTPHEVNFFLDIVDNNYFMIDTIISN